jgi:hypothetical protein
MELTRDGSEPKESVKAHDLRRRFGVLQALASD